MTDSLPDLLTQRLSGELPRPPEDWAYGARPPLWSHYDPPPDARPAAVLVLLYPVEGCWHVPLTLRAADLACHAGQISLPGGAVEPGETGRQAAIREFHEELGAEGCDLQMLGRLTPLYVRASNFRVVPWVAAAAERPHWKPCPCEVAQLLEVPLSHLCDEANLDNHPREYRGQPYTAGHITWQSHRIWGATCMILGELVTLLGAAV